MKMKKPLILGLVTLLSLSACGKSLHLKALKSNQANGGAPRVAPLATEVLMSALSEADLKEESVVALKNQLSIKTEAPAVTAPEGEVPSEGSAGSEGASLEVAGDAVEGSEAVVEEASNLINLGGAQATFTKDGKEIGYNKSAALVMQAELRLPEKKSVKKVKTLTLKISKIRRFESTDANVSSMAGQILCVVEGMLCSGEKVGLAGGDALQVKSDLFSKGTALELEQVIEANNKVFATNTLTTIDLKAALGLTDESALEFLYANTKSGDAQSRSLRLMLGNQTQIEAASISYELQ
jgi:hypothetical protein